MALDNARLYDRGPSLADRDPLPASHPPVPARSARRGDPPARRSGGAAGVLMIDLDDFKLVNDTLGHQFGDQVLRWAAEQIRSTLRASDVAARYGGDEFAVILPDTAAAGAREAADRIVAALRDQLLPREGRGPVPVGASIGVAAFPTHARTARALIAVADAALYRVKASGGRGVQGRVRRRLAATSRRAG